MKKMKRAVVLLLAAAMAGSALAGCGGGGASESSKTPASTPESSAAAPSGEVVTLKVWGFVDGQPKTEDVNEVAEAVSKITRDKIGAEVELTRSNDPQKLNLALTAGEKWDLTCYHGYPGGLASLVANGLATPLDDLLTNYGKDIPSVVSETEMKADRFNGVLYALPNQKDNAAGTAFAMRRDVLSEIGVDESTIKDWNDIHEVLQKVKEARPDLYPMVSSWGGGGMSTPIAKDDLGNSLGVLDLSADPKSTTVVNYFATDAYREFCERMYQWNQEGLIMPDITSATEFNLLGTVGFSILTGTKPGKHQECINAYGVDCALIELVAPYRCNGNIQGSSFIIPTTSEHPEQAMALWNLMYTDAEVSNLFINGIEGKHWVYTDDTKTFITVPEGVDTTASPYPSQEWAWPNQRITPPYAGNDADVWQQMQKFCDEALPSPALGFSYDNSNVLNEETACQNVVSKYDLGLRWGILNPTETIPQFISELEAAGINTIITDKQAQIDEWLKAIS